MKRLIILLILLFAVPAFATNPTDGTTEYTFGTVSGGTDNALDSVDGANLSGGETSSVKYDFGSTGYPEYVTLEHILCTGVSWPEDGFFRIAPDNNPSTKMWILSNDPGVTRATDPSALLPSAWKIIWNELP